MAVSVFFVVKIDDNDLGSFNSCDGLGIEVVLEQREEGGNNGFVWQLPTRIKYSNVKLTRSVGRDSAKLTAWLVSFASGVKRQTATISAMTAEGKVVATWNLDGVIPVRWTGPSLSRESAKIATETVELAHHGFLPGTGA
jgi:phage tail-like protein